MESISLIDCLASTLTWVTFVSVGEFSTRYFLHCYAILRTQKGHDNEIPFFPLPIAQKDRETDKADERVFAEASELARLRLEQCIADLHIWLPPTNDTRQWQSGRGVLA